MKTKEKGITLVALVVTIVILLILAGISIASLTGSGLFAKAQQAQKESENAQAEENATLAEYEQWMGNYLGGSSSGSKTLASKVQPGDYVTYTPDTANTTAILGELTEHSGSTANTSSTLTQEIGETGLKWRVLDVVGNKVRLISEEPTKSKVTLSGYNGYNNAVYLLDKTCKTLYSKAGYSEKVQNLKIEDIQNKMSTDYTTIDSSYGQPFTPTNKYYPSILLQEEGQTVTTSDGTEQPTTRLGLSEQETPINPKQTLPKQATSLSLKYTYWSKTMVAGDSGDFGTNSIYYNLFIKKKNEDETYSNYSTYWLSSRCVNARYGDACFVVRAVGSECVGSGYLYYSYDNPINSSCALRPVITLNYNVLVTTGDGTLAIPYEIGL